ncbi:MAG: DMT family transporter [Planctomycetes bacterium]|nr:DMT family transporter [Planctomycetota bacterium]
MSAHAAALDARERRKGYIALLWVQVLFGLFPAVRHWAPDHFSARAIVGWRILVGAGVLGGAAFALHRRSMLPRREDWGRLVVCALFGIAINMVLFLEGLDRSTPVNAALIMPVIPVFTYAIASLLGIERFDPLRGVGIAVALTGTLVLLLQRGPDLSHEYLFGNLLMLTNAASYAYFLVLARPLTQRYPPLVVIGWVFLLAAPTVPLFAWNAEFFPAGAGGREWGALVFVLLGATVGAYLLNTYALSKVSASTTAAYIYLQPLVTCAADYFWLGRPLQHGLLVAAALIFTGLALVLKRSKARAARTGLAEGEARP